MFELTFGTFAVYVAAANRRANRCGSLAIPISATILGFETPVLSHGMEKTEVMAEKPNTTMPGTVKKIIKPVHPEMPEKAEIAVDGADELYREIRIENTLKDEQGNEVKLKPGAQVEVTVEAESKDTEVKEKSAGKD
jgi:hypothetical protein